MTLTRETPAALGRRLQPGRSRATERGTRLVVLRVIAAAAMVVLAMRITLPQSVLVGYLVAAALLPLWLPLLSRFRFGWAVTLSGLLALGAGVWLEVAGSAMRETDAGVFTSSNILMVGSVLTVGLVLWARTVISDSWVAFWFGIGLVLSIQPGSTLFHSNPWKFGFYLPVAITVLALARMTRRWWVELLVLLALTAVSAASDARSAFGLLLLAAVLLIAQSRVLRRGHNGSSLLVFLGVLTISVVVWAVGQAAILGGYLGSATQARSLAQVQTSGSLILGGRPELAATLALMKATPWGFGSGIAPSDGDILTAKAGMQAIGYDPENNYVNGYMFGGHFELHSVFGDLWAQSGIAGLLFIAVALVALLWAVSRRIADGTASGIVLFVVATSIWLTLFGPWQSTAPFLVIALGLVAVPKPAVTRLIAGTRLPRQRRANSTTVSMGPLQRFSSRRPAAVKTASSADAESDG